LELGTWDLTLGTWNLGLETWDLKLDAWNLIIFNFQASNIKHPTSNIKHPTSNIQHQASNIKHPKFTEVIMKNQSLFAKMLCLLFVMIVLSMVSYTLVLQKVQNEFLLRQAKSVSRQIILTRQWISGLGGVWPKDVYTK